MGENDRHCPVPFGSPRRPGISRSGTGSRHPARPQSPEGLTLSQRWCPGCRFVIERPARQAGEIEGTWSSLTAGQEVVERGGPVAQPIWFRPTRVSRMAVIALEFPQVETVETSLTPARKGGWPSCRGVSHPCPQGPCRNVDGSSTPTRASEASSETELDVTFAPSAEQPSE